MRTTVTLEDDVARTVKDEMKAGSGKTFKEALNDLIRLGRYYRQDRKTNKRKVFKVQSFDMGVYKHLDYDNIAELLDEIEGPFRR